MTAAAALKDFTAGFQKKTFKYHLYLPLTSEWRGQQEFLRLIQKIEHIWLNYFLCEGMDTSEPNGVVVRLALNHFNHQTISKAFR